jgi:hypothetical protein
MFDLSTHSESVLINMFVCHPLLVVVLLAIINKHINLFHNPSIASSSPLPPLTSRVGDFLRYPEMGRGSWRRPRGAGCGGKHHRRCSGYIRII